MQHHIVQTRWVRFSGPKLHLLQTCSAGFIPRFEKRLRRATWSPGGALCAVLISTIETKTTMTTTIIDLVVRELYVDLQDVNPSGKEGG
jgi:hypothetical protein